MRTFRRDHGRVRCVGNSSFHSTHRLRGAMLWSNVFRNIQLLLCVAFAISIKPAESWNTSFSSVIPKHDRAVIGRSLVSKQNDKGWDCGRGLVCPGCTYISQTVADLVLSAGCRSDNYPNHIHNGLHCGAASIDQTMAGYLWRNECHDDCTEEADALCSSPGRTLLQLGMLAFNR